MLNWLKEYLKETPLETAKSEFKAIQEKFPEGVNAFDYIEYSKVVYQCNIPPDIQTFEIILTSKLTSDFSGSFFLV
jgi:hypothetical protein